MCVESCYLANTSNLIRKQWMKSHFVQITLQIPIYIYFYICL